MRLVLLSEVFCQGRGYLENMLPKYLARLGVETHVVVTDLSPFFRTSALDAACSGFAAPLKAGTIEHQDGYTLHVLGHRKVAGHMRMEGLGKKLSDIRPDIVQTMTPIGWIALDAALLKLRLGYRLFSGCHYHASVFPLAHIPSPSLVERLHCQLTRTIPGWAGSLLTEKCYAIAPDCADLAVRFFGVPKSKVELCQLGVDTELFNPAVHPVDVNARLELRVRLGFEPSDIVCIYTGRFSEDKNPLLLAQAITLLAKEGKPFRGLFVGSGSQGKAIEQTLGCRTLPYVPVQELPELFRAADIGVWPTQESTSMLDASACGIPIIANHTILATERLNGNGLHYKLDDQTDLVKALRSLERKEVRQQMGELGAAKMARDFSWAAIARRRLRDYETSLRAVPNASAHPVSEDPAKTGLG